MGILWSTLFLLLLLLLIMHSSVTAAPYDVVYGHWKRRKGPEIQAAHFVQVTRVTTPPLSVIYDFIPVADEAIRNVELSPELGSRLPESCHAVDEHTLEPRAEGAGSETYENFERLKPWIFSPRSAAYGATIHIRFGRIPNSSSDALFLRGSERILVRCGPLMKPPTNPQPPPQSLLPSSAFAAGTVPDGWTPFTETHRIPNSTFIFFSIVPSNPYFILTNQSRSLLSEALLDQKPPRVDASELVLRRDGLHIHILAAYDRWIDYENRRQHDLLKRVIASSFTCSPLPCHVRLRNRTHTHVSASDWLGVTPPPANPLNFSRVVDDVDVLTTVEEGGEEDRIIRASDVTLSPDGAAIDVSPEALDERGFDLLPIDRPPKDNVQPNGKEVATPVSLYHLQFVPPIGITERWAEHKDHVPAGEARWIYSMSAYPYWPPEVLLKEYNATLERFVPSPRGMSITEDSVSGRGGTPVSREALNIVLTLGFSRPRHQLVPHRYPRDVYLDYLLRDEHVEGSGYSDVGSNNAALLRCRRNRFGRVDARQFFDWEERPFVDGSRADVLVLHRRFILGFDIDRPVRLSLALPYFIFNTYQPIREAPAITVVPSNGRLVANATTPLRRLTADSEAVQFDVSFAWQGDVVFPDAVTPSALYSALLVRSLRIMERRGDRPTNSVADTSWYPLPSCLEVRVFGINTSQEPTCGGLVGVTGSAAVHSRGSRSILHCIREHVQSISKAFVLVIVSNVTIDDTANWTAAGLPLTGDPELGSHQGIMRVADVALDDYDDDYDEL